MRGNGMGLVVGVFWLLLDYFLIEIGEIVFLRMGCRSELMGGHEGRERYRRDWGCSGDSSKVFRP